jgi:cytochrome b561
MAVRLIWFKPVEARTIKARVRMKMTRLARLFIYILLLGMTIYDYLRESNNIRKC